MVCPRSPLSLAARSPAVTACDDLSTLAAFIAYDDMRFSSVKGTATFTWIATDDSWDETFTYVLDFDEQDKIVRYQIWGDTGALYLASKGLLGTI